MIEELEPFVGIIDCDRGAEFVQHLLVAGNMAMDQVADDLGIGFRVESVTLGLQRLLDFLVVLDDAVVNHRDTFGGHVRVGLEDNLYLGKGVLATNGKLVEKAVSIVENLGASVAGPERARELIGVRSRNDR